ncbi:uncharacterized protein EI90DRAFT_2559123 [Cantharellus anzutake]|uniref:uncharacterized protein n=1 Tax=Cantharellus anzutake TaxID=1750568 RepID=UPI001904F026|nr:uncharacterized protein EI90DRAFT_2559123 [Cantharellus anzutake]KAF8338184.1 hypothetical protein EI90DRAFT_2559123 [Cantharellus anzutake]
MLGILDNSSSPKESQTPTHDAPINLPAFLDLADSAARLNSNLPDINARIEQKRQEHQQQRELQRRHFEEQMRALEAKQAEEEQALLLTPMVSLGDGLNEHIALSAPTTPPRNSFGLSDPASVVSGLPIFHQQSVLNDLVDYSKRSSVNYSVVANSESVTPGSHNHTAGAKSMPGSRRGSSGSHESAVNDMTASLLLGSLSLKDPHGPSQPPSRTPHRSQTGPVASNISAASLFDQDLDNEITNSLRHLPTQTEDERVNVRAHYARKLSVSSNALDLAPLQQSRPFSSRITDSVGLTSSEWPQFSGPPRPAEFSGLRLNTRSSSHNLAIGTDSPSTLSVPTPIVTQSPDVSRKSSPPTFSDASSLTGHTTLSSARSVPATPLTNLSNPTLRTDLGIVSTKTPGGPVSPSQPVERGTPGSSDVAHPTFSRVSPVNYDAVAYSSIRGDDLHNSYANDPLYLPNNTLDIPFFKRVSRLAQWEQREHGSIWRHGHKDQRSRRA